jgi:hypothetical protein
MNAYIGPGTGWRCAHAILATSRATELTDCLTPNPEELDRSSRDV